MISLLTKAIKWLPGIGTWVANKLGGSVGDSQRAQELRAEAQLEEAKALRKGKYAPRYVRNYAIILMGVFLFVLVLADMLMPEFSIDWNAPVDALKALFSLWSD